MLKICLVFWKSEPQYAYKRYAYKKNMYENMICFEKCLSSFYNKWRRVCQYGYCLWYIAIILRFA